MSSAVLRAIFATWARVSAIFAEASMPSTRRGRSWSAKPAIMPAWVLPVTLHTTIVSKKTPSSRSCCRTSTAQLAKPRPPRGWSEAPAGIAYGVLPAVLEADAEPCLYQTDVGPHDAGQQDVADLVVDRVRPVHPALLNQDGLQACPGGDRGDLPRVVGLHPADADQGVRALPERVGDQVLQLPGLVAAEGQPAVAVFSFGPDAGAAEVIAEPVQRMHGAGAEQQGVTLEVVQGHR